MAALLLLPACSGATTEKPSQNPSGQKSPSSEIEKTAPLREEYQYLNKMWYLNIKPRRLIATNQTLKFTSIKEMKEKFMNLSFTEEEYMVIETMASNGRIAVIDPRLFESLNLPEGVVLENISYRSNYAKSNFAPVSCRFFTTISDSSTYGSRFTAVMIYRGNIGNPYTSSVLEQWINASGKYDTDGYPHIEETQCKGYPALRLTKFDESVENFGQKTVYWRYVVEKNGRTYYVSDKILYADNSEKEILSRVLDVHTMHMNCEYSYSIENPTEECVDNILEYDPFTYVEIVE